MKERDFSNFKEAMTSFTVKDRNYIFVRHTLEQGEEIKSHYHKKANEWLIIDNGWFTVKIGDKEKSFSLHNNVLVIRFPKGQNHSFLAKSKVSYFVFRDYEDKSIYTQEVKNG